MKTGDETSLAEGEILEMGSLMKALEIQVKKFEEAYEKKDSQKFNSLKKDILQMQRRIYNIVR